MCDYICNILLFRVLPTTLILQLNLKINEKITLNINYTLYHTA